MTVLRPYQTEAVRRVRWQYKLLRELHPNEPARIILVAPTGAGKTAMAGDFVQGAARKGSRTLWLAHRTELIDQAWARLRTIGIDAGVIMAERRARPDLAVQVASVQTITARKTAPDDIDIIVADEAHHAAAETWRAILEAYPNAKAVIGLTATPERSDGTALDPPFERMVVACQIGQLIEEGWLLPCDVKSPSAIRGKRGGYLARKDLVQHPVDAYEQHCNGERAVCFTQYVIEAEQWAEEARRRGIEARAVHGQTPTKERSATLAGLADGRVKLVTNPMVLTEGWDCPAVSCAIIARGCSSMSLWLQMGGRVLRPSEGRAKTGERAKVIDLRGHVWVHGRFEEDREYSLKGKPMKKKDDCWRCPPPCDTLNDKDAEECASCGEPRPEPKRRDPQKIEEEALSTATKEAVRAMWKDKHHEWKRLLSKMPAFKAEQEFRALYGHRVPSTFLKGVE